MARTKQEKQKEQGDVLNAGRMESEIYQPDNEVAQEFADAQKLGSGSELLKNRLKEHHSLSPTLSGGDIDAAWDEANVGEESVAGGNPTPDQDVVEEIGEAMGLTYEDNEAIGMEEKLGKRDRDRWELNPVSSEDYAERSK